MRPRAAIDLHTPSCNGGPVCRVEFGVIPVVDVKRAKRFYADIAAAELARALKREQKAFADQEVDTGEALAADPTVWWARCIVQEQVGLPK